MHPVQAINMAWEAEAIAKCMEDPVYRAKVESGKWCAVCEMGKPCLCDKNSAVAEMRRYYEANRRTWFRREPKLIGSWGRDMDGLMTELYKIATRAYRRI